MSLYCFCGYEVLLEVALRLVRCSAACLFAQSQAYNGASCNFTKSTFLITMTQQAVHEVMIIRTQSCTRML